MIGTFVKFCNSLLYCPSLYVEGSPKTIMGSAPLLMLLLLLSSDLGSSKSMDDAMKEFLAVLNKLGTGRCLPTEFRGFLQSVKDCAESKQFSRSSHYCDILENSMQCYDHLESCYSGKNLDKFKAAAMELSVQTIGAFSDEIEDMLQDCPIYRELVGMRNSKKVLYVGIGVGLLVVVALVAGLIYRKTRRYSSYNHTDSELKSFQVA